MLGSSEAVVRVKDGVGPHHGRMEYYVNGSWSSICADSLPDVTGWPSLFCRQLGKFSEASTVVYASKVATINAGTGDLKMTNPTCPSSAVRFSDCTSATSCDHSLDLVIGCRGMFRVLREHSSLFAHTNKLY